MVAINRPAINTNLGGITTVLDRSLHRVMARRAQALQLTELERVPIAVMRRDVIDRGRGRYQLMLFKTHPAQRMFDQLRTATLFPA
jgi:hypothetical protein